MSLRRVHQKTSAVGSSWFWPLLWPSLWASLWPSLWASLWPSLWPSPYGIESWIGSNAGDRFGGRGSSRNYDQPKRNYYELGIISVLTLNRTFLPTTRLLLRSSSFFLLRDAHVSLGGRSTQRYRSSRYRTLRSRTTCGSFFLLWTGQFQCEFSLPELITTHCQVSKRNCVCDEI